MQQHRTIPFLQRPQHQIQALMFAKDLERLGHGMATGLKTQ